MLNIMWGNLTNKLRSCILLSIMIDLIKPSQKFYFVWRNIKSRCLNKNHPQYKDYGGRG